LPRLPRNQRSTQSAVLPAEGLFAAAFENAPHPMAIIGADGRIAHATRSLCRLLGFSREELCTLLASDLIHPDDKDTEHAQRTRLAAADIGRYELIQRCIRKDLGVVWTRVAVSAVRTGSLEPAYFVAEFESVPAHNCAERTMEHGAWFARVGDATLSAIHEIGNTLTPLMMNTQMLVEQSRSHQVAEAADQIFKAARRIAFALRRLRSVQDVQPAAYVGQNRMLDLRMVPPISDTQQDDSGAAGAA
jgi:PAS domain S-box-containing protein